MLLNKICSWTLKDTYLQKRTCNDQSIFANIIHFIIIYGIHFKKFLDCFSCTNLLYGIFKVKSIVNSLIWLLHNFEYIVKNKFPIDRVIRCKINENFIFLPEHECRVNQVVELSEVELTEFDCISPGTI